MHSIRAVSNDGADIFKGMHGNPHSTNAMIKNRKLTLLHTGRAEQPCVDTPELKPLLYYHIPKCAGTTLDYILLGLANTTKRPYLRASGVIYNQKFAGREKTDALEKIKNLEWPRNWFYASGHIPYGKFAPADSASNEIAMIRDPASRLISMFGNGVRRGAWAEDARIKDIFDAGLLVADSMARQLAGEISATAKLSEEHVEMALENYKRIKYKGPVENFESVVCSILADYGVSYVAFQNLQVGGQMHLANESQLVKEFEPYLKLDEMFFHRASNEVRQKANGFMEINVDDLPPDSRVLCVTPNHYVGGEQVTAVYVDVETLRKITRGIAP